MLNSLNYILQASWLPIHLKFLDESKNHQLFKIYRTGGHSPPC